MKALACFSTLAGTISAVRSSPNRKIGSRSLRLRLAASTSSRICHCARRVLRAVDRNQPAGLAVEDIDQPPRVFVAEAGHDAKAFLLDRGGELPHAASGGVLAFVVLVDDRDGKRLQEFHRSLPAAARLELVLPGELDAHVVGRVAVELLELAPQQLGAAPARSSPEYQSRLVEA